MIGYRNSLQSAATIGLASLLLFLAGALTAATIPVDSSSITIIEPIDDPGILPYRFRIELRWPGLANDGRLASARFVPVSKCGTGKLSLYDIVDSWKVPDSTSSLILYADYRHAQAISHYHLPTQAVSSYLHTDLDHDGICEIAVTYRTRDSIWLRVYNELDGMIVEMPLATGKDIDGNGIWDGSAQILTAADINGDNIPELFVNVDVGYDLYPRLLLCLDPLGRRIIWQYELANIVSDRHFWVGQLEPGQPPQIVVGTISKGNAAVTKNADDRHSYVIILDRHGREQFRYEAGGIFTGANAVVVQYDDDPSREIVLPSSTSLSGIVGDSSGPTLKLVVLDHQCHRLDSTIVDGPGKISRLTSLDTDGDGRQELIVHTPEGHLTILDQQLQVLTRARFPSAAEVWHADDFLGRGDYQLLIKSADARMWLMDQDMNPLAQMYVPEVPLEGYTGYRQPGPNGGYEISLAADRGRLYYIVSFHGSPWSTVFSRYPWLVVLITFVPMALLVVAIAFAWIRSRRLNKQLSEHRDRLHQTVDQLKLAQQKLVAAGELTKAQEALRTSEQRFRELAELLPQTVFELSLEGNLTYTNHSGMVAFGYESEDIAAGLSCERFFIEHERERVWDNVRKILIGGMPDDHEYLAQRKDGSTFPAMVYSSPIIRDGKPAGLRGIVVDTTELKRSQRALTESEERYRTLVESAQEAIFVVDRHGTYQFVNQIAADRLGGTPEKFVGKALHDVFPKGVADRHLASIQLVFDSDRGKLIESMTFLQGHEHHYLTSLQPIRDADGCPTSVLGIGRDNTEYVNAQRELRESEEKYRLLVENVNATIGLIARDGTFLFLNEQAAADHGWTSRELVGRNMSDLFPPEDRDNLMALVQRVIDTDKEFTGEITTTIRGEKRWFYAIMHPYREPSADVPTALLIAHDLTETKTTRTALQASEQRYATLVESARDGILVAAAQDGSFLYANQAMCTMVGRSLEEMQQLEVGGLSPADFRSQSQAKFRSLLTGGQNFISDVPVKRSDGTVVYVDINAIGQEYAGRDAVIGFFRDVTQRREAEQSLRESEERFRAIAEASPLPLAMARIADGRIIYGNPMLGPALGYGTDEVIGQEVAKFHADPAEYEASMRQLEQHGQVTNMEVRLRKRDGTEVYALISLRCITFEGEAVVFGSFNDITERRRTEEALQEASQERYEQARRIAGSIAHEIYNALFPASSSVAKLKERLQLLSDADQDRNRKLLDLTERAVRRALNATDLVKTYSRLEAEKKAESTSLAGIVAEVVQSHSIRLENLNIEIDCQIPQEAQVVIRHSHAFSLFSNLLVNSIDALADVEGLRRVSVRARSTEEGWEIVFEDSGPGISQDTRGQVFKAFYTTKPSIGTGLGLAMVRQIVELYGGRIELASHIDKTSKFVILLLASGRE